MAGPSPERRLAGFIDKFSPEGARIARGGPPWSAIQFRSRQGAGAGRSSSPCRRSNARADPSNNRTTLEAFLAAFNAHDLDAIMEFFAEDCAFDMPRGTKPWGTRYVGRKAVREGLATRFAGIPDVHYGDDAHWVAGDLGVSTWLLTGTTRTGDPIRVRGVDLLEFRDGKVVEKDSYWKIVEK